MGRAWGAILLIIILSSLSASALTLLPDTNNIARVFDFDADGKNELLTFSDRIDTRDSPMRYYDYQRVRFTGIDEEGSRWSIGHKTFYAFHNLTSTLHQRCALSYWDYNNDSMVDVYANCFNSTNNLSTYLWNFNRTARNFSSSPEFPATPDVVPDLGDTAYGDVIFRDLNNDGYGDIISCFLGDNNLSLFLYNSTNNNFSVYDSGISTDIFKTSGTIDSCYLLPLDFDGDGDLDIITYRYDSNRFELYNNTFCNRSDCNGFGFTNITSTDFWNTSIFEDAKIKQLKAFDDNQDGFSDLFYVIDDTTAAGSSRNITFGKLFNRHRTLSHEPTIEPPTIENIVYHLNNPSQVNMSWVNYSNTSDYFTFNISQGLLSTGSRDEHTHLTYNLNITDSENNTIISGTLPTDNYDYNAQLGNLLTRRNLEMELPTQYMQIRVQAIAPGMLRSSWSSPYIYTTNISGQAIELCDGLDNDGDGVADEAFNFTWPDGFVSEVNFDNDNDGHSPKFQGYIHRNGTHNMTVIFNCTLRRERKYGDFSPWYDHYANGSSADFDPSIMCRDLTLKDCNPEYTSPGGGNSGSSPSNGVIPSTAEDDNSDQFPKDAKSFIDADDTSASNTEKEVENPIPQKESPAPSFTPEQKLINFTTHNALRHTRSITYAGGQTRVTETIRNVDFAPQQDINVTVTIPKHIEESAYDIIRIDNFTIIDPDPIIQFHKDSLAYLRTASFSYIIDDHIEDFEASVEISARNASSYAQMSKADQVQDQFSRTEELLNITKTYKVEDNATTYRLNFDFKDNETILYNVSIFEEIPKCLLEIINEEIAESDRDFEIVNEDPVIVWHFDQLLKGEEIQLRISAVSDQDCLNLGDTLALAREIIAVKKSEGNLVIWPPLAMIAGLLILLIFMANFTREKYHISLEVQRIIRKAKRLLRQKHSLEYIHDHLIHDHDPQDVHHAIQAIRHPVRQFFIRTAIGLETFILISLIILNVLDFFKILPGDIDFIKKIISWILLALVFYHVGISKVLFGRDRQWIDITLLISYFLLTMKNFVGFARQTFIETEFVHDLYIFIINHNVQFETITFLLGLAGLLSVASFMTVKKHIHKESLMGALFIHHSESHHTHFQRFWQILFVLVVFFVLVFNLMFEWLAIAVDAPILVVVIIITLILIISRKLHKHYHETPGHLIETITEAPDHFYEKMIDMFHHPKFLPLGIAGMFVLHILTEIGIYVIPYMLGIIDPVYVNILDARHTPLFSITGQGSLFGQSAQGFSSWVVAQFATGYALNLIALAAALLIPIWLWSYMYRHKHKPLFGYSVFHAFIHHDSRFTEITARILVVALPAAGIIALARPAFLFRAIRNGLLAGVDIMTRTIGIEGLLVLVAASCITCIAILLMEKKHLFFLTCGILLVSAVSIVLYDYLYLKSMILYIMSLARLLVDWSGLWIVVRNITVIFTLAVSGISIGALYVVAAGLVGFLYLPTRIKKRLHHLLPKHIAEAQHHHHIHFHHLHDHHFHGHKVVTVKEHIRQQLEYGHELFVIVEHLHEHGWPWEVIEQAVVELDGTKRFDQELAHVRHSHHKKQKIRELGQWMQKHYGQKKHLEAIIRAALKAGWTEDDVGIALTHVRLRKKDRHIKDFLENIPQD
ncbi:MAG: FG-GAP-like repeat-containing protein [Nanoarchaeota archaeon]